MDETGREKLNSGMIEKKDEVGMFRCVLQIEKKPLSDLAEYLASAKGDSELDQLSQAETIIASSKEKQAEDSMLILSPAEKRAESLLGLLKSASPQSISDIKLNAIIGSFVSDPPSSAEVKK